MPQCKPSIVVVPGAYALPDLYVRVTTRLASLGYEVHTIRLSSVAPSDGPLPEPGTMYDDAAVIAREINQLVEQGKEVVVLAHSYGGMPASQSIQGLVKREGSEHAGGVVQLAYMTAVVPPEGKSSVDVLANGPSMDISVDEKGWMSLVDTAAVAAAAFSDVPPDEGMTWAQQFTHHSAASMANPLTYAGYKDVPVAYLLCTEDLVIPAEVQQKMIDTIASEGGQEVDVTRIATGHVSVTSAPELVVDWILRILSREVK